jgi:hypothetical protein
MGKLNPVYRSLKDFCFLRLAVTVSLWIGAAMRKSFCRRFVNASRPAMDINRFVT